MLACSDTDKTIFYYEIENTSFLPGLVFDWKVGYWEYM